MARTATLDPTAEAPASKTFKEYTPPRQEYHLLIRTVAPRANEQGGITGDMFDASIQDWLNGGWQVHTISYIGEVKGHAGESFGSSFAFHLVRTNE